MELKRVVVTGLGTINVSVNGLQKCVLTLGETSESITLDADTQEAYFNGELKNRKMQGLFPTLEVGKNVISWTGNLTKIEITHYSRWL